VFLGASHLRGTYSTYPIQAIPKEDLESNEVKSQIEAYNLTIQDKISHSPGQYIPLTLYREDQEEDLLEDSPLEPDSCAPHVDEIQADMYDSFLMTKPILSHEGEFKRAKIVGRKRNQDGNPIGRYNANPLLNARIYLAEFPDGHTAEFSHAAKFSANMVSEALYNQVGDDAYNISIFKSIIGHEPSLEPNSSDVNTGNDMNKVHSNGTTLWLPLSDVKNSFPVHLANYVINNGLQDLPAFSWWVNRAIKKRQASIKATKSTYSQRTHKFGIKVPKTVQDALHIDKQTGTTFWYEAIQKEMK
jgi:hypothetical protein